MLSAPRSWTLLLLLALLLAPGARAGGDAAEAEEVERIRQLGIHWVSAVAAKDLDAIVDLYAPDGRFMPPNDPGVEGRRAIRKAWKMLLEIPGMVLIFKPVSIEVSEAADMASDIGTYTLSFDGPDGRQEDRGKYLVVWKKVDGAWKVAADMFNSDLAAP